MSGQDSPRPILLFRCRVPAWAGEEHLAAGLAHLPARLQAGILRYRRLPDRLQRLVARRLLGKALETAGLGRFASLESWRTDPRGRPYLEGCAADFSVSHSAPWVVGALAVGARVGVDIETCRSMELEGISPYLSAPELARIAGAAEPCREALRCWVMREAILKADGRGLLAPEKDIRNIRNLKTPLGHAWRVENLPVEQACLCLATDHATAPILVRDRDFQTLL